MVLLTKLSWDALKNDWLPWGPPSALGPVASRVRWVMPGFPKPWATGGTLPSTTTNTVGVEGRKKGGEYQYFIWKTSLFFC